MTIASKIAAAGGRPSGFDYLRLILAVSVIFWHGIFVAHGFEAEAPFWTGPLRPLPMFIVPAFFALSGFLVAGSLERNSLPAFLTLRAVRIFPALVVEVVLCALILGPVLTTLPLREYFSDPLFARYFLNILGIIQYELPGLFGGGPVNLQLWTVPFELECYIALAILALFKIPQRRLAFTLIVCALTVALTVENLIHTPWPLNFRAPGRMLVLSFLFGVTIYLWRDRLAAGPVVVLSAGVASWAALTSAETLFIASAPVAYFTVLVGIQNWRRVFVIKGADYSYGIYLYGFPIQMTIKELFPSANSWTFNVVASVPIAALFAYVSWTYLEARVVESKGAILAKVAKLEALMKSLKRSRASSLVGQSALPDTRDIGAPSDAPRPPHLP